MEVIDLTGSDFIILSKKNKDRDYDYSIPNTVIMLDDKDYDEMVILKFDKVKEDKVMDNNGINKVCASCHNWGKCPTKPGETCVNWELNHCQEDREKAKRANG